MFPEKVHRYIYLFGLFGLAFGMMIGTVPTSLPQLILMGNWLLEFDFKRKWETLKGNKIFWILSSVFLIHVLGLLYTTDLEAGWNDVRTKIPLMFLPMLFLSSKPISVKEFHTLLYCFIAGCIVNALWCFTYTFVLHNNEVVRNASRFMSHIRLGLYLNVAICCCVYFFLKTGIFLRRMLFVMIVLFFLFSLYALGLMSGIVNFVILLSLFLVVLIYFQKPVIKIVAFMVLLALIFAGTNYFFRVKDQQLEVNNTKNNVPTKNTPWGKPYIHFDSTGQKENGNYVLINIQLEELQREWKRIFPEDSFSYTSGHNIHRYEVLVRYLASKGLNKDSAAVTSLSTDDRQNIRNNIFNYQYPSWSFFHRRIYELVNEIDEFKDGRHVNGHSLTMRLYFWEAGLHLVKQNPVLGVGTGDVQQALNKSYRETNSPLEEEWFKRPHNQFLTITVALGVIGLVIFLTSLIYPVIVLRNSLPKLYWPFLLIAILSFLVEDTLETQAGLTFFGFFNSLFISRGYFRSKE